MRALARSALVLAAAAALLAGCGDTDQPQGAAEPDAPSGAATGGADVPDVVDDGPSGTVTLYAAASLQAAFADLITQFEQVNPSVVVEPPVFDGSATLVTQLTEGAEADVFASADEATMDTLVAAGLNDGEPALFATNTLVIAVAPGNPLGIEDLDDLAGLDYVVCAPEVPCGNATTTLFERAGLELDPLSLEQNVTAVAERVINGDADAGLVYATDVASRSEDLEAVVPSNAADVVNRYPITLLQGADPAASVFVEFVLGADGQSVLAEHGFGQP